MTKKIYSQIVYSVLVVSILITNSCSVTNKIYEEKDVVYSTKRLELKLSYRRFERKSPIYYMEQSIIKEIASNNEAIYKVYDVLTLTSSSFKIEDKVFLIIDDEVFPMLLDFKEYENTKEISENTKNIMTSDSTNISVVTGYSINNRKITRFSYKLTDKVIEKLQKSDEVLFRYYSGPSMLTIPLRGKKINKLKQLISMK